MKRFIVILTSLLFSKALLAEHITGGEMFYTYTGQAANGDHQYHVTLKLYRDCFSAGAQLDASAAIAVAGINSRPNSSWDSLRIVTR